MTFLVYHKHRAGRLLYRLRLNRQWMHFDGANEIAMAPIAAPAADPVSAFGFVLVSAAGTPAAGSSF